MLISASQEVLRSFNCVKKMEHVGGFRWLTIDCCGHDDKKSWDFTKNANFFIRPVTQSTTFSTSRLKSHETKHLESRKRL